METKRYIYITTNKINGMSYIGQRKTLKENDTYLGSGKYFQRAVKKYGHENFEKQILEYCQSDDELNQKEREYIKKYNAVKDDNFYNLSYGNGRQGADSLNRKTHSEIMSAIWARPEVRLKQSHIQKRIQGSDYIRQKKSRMNKLAWGKKTAEEMDLHRAKSRRPRGLNGRAKQVLIRGQKLNCIADACEFLKMSRKQFFNAIKKQTDWRVLNEAN